MTIKKFTKVKVIRGIHKGKTGTCKSFMGKHDILIEFPDGELDVVCIIDVKKA